MLAWLLPAAAVILLIGTSRLVQLCPELFVQFRGLIRARKQPKAVWSILVVFVNGNIM